MDSSGALYLTPLLQDGRVSEARNLSKVGMLPGGIIRESYSGFITLSKELRTHTFFWFFPAKNNPEHAPVILWLEGGGGLSFFIGVFNQNGPFKLKPGSDRVEFLEAELDWTRDYSVIYVETPIGAGYSFTEDEKSYSTTSEHAAQGVYEFLIQFFQLFPHLRKNSFHIAAYSYGARFAVALGDLILRRDNSRFGALLDEKNDLAVEFQLKLDGVMLFAPYLDARCQTVDCGTFYYNLGLITKEDKEQMDKEAELLSHLLEQGRLEECTQKLFRLVGSLSNTYFTESSGLRTNLNILQDRRDLEEMSTISLLADQDSTFRKAIHAGNVSFSMESEAAEGRMMVTDCMRSMAHFLDKILNQDIPILVVSGQMDARAYHLGIERIVSTLKWKGSEAYTAAERKHWRVEEELVGYAKSSGGLTYVMIRNAGHVMYREKPLATLDLLRRAVNGMPW